MAEIKQIWDGVSENAAEQLGVGKWDRPAIFCDSAGAACDGDLPYWLVLLLSGAIATLGLALNSAAVVIGAMLVAPLLAPVMGVAIALAVGDARLAVQAAAMVLASTIGVVVLAALLTVSLPFHTITPEISARTLPTTLDMAIAVFSGLVGAVVTVSREKRLSAAIPGVAISVALIPPLAVAGFGIGVGWNWDIVGGSLLLYGANLAGIILSGMVVFMLIGMYCPAVAEAARAWHGEDHPTGLAAWVDGIPGVRNLGSIRSARARIGLVLAFVVALGFPLSRTLQQIAREARVRNAIASASEGFQVPGRASILNQQVVSSQDGTQVYLHVATARGFDRAAVRDFERAASARAGEPVRLVLEQLPASGGDLKQLAALFAPRAARPVAATASSVPVPEAFPGLLAEVRERATQATRALAFPDGTSPAGSEVLVDGAGRGVVEIAYTAAAPLEPQAKQILERQLRAALRSPGLGVRFTPVPALPLALADSAAPTRLRELGALMRHFGGLRLALLAGDSVPGAGIQDATARLAAEGLDRSRIDVVRDGGAGIRLRVLPASLRPDSTPSD